LNFGVTTKLVGATFGLCGFAVAIIAGLSAGNPSDNVLAGALLSMIVCQGTGLVAGAIGERAVREHMNKHRQAHPLPGAPHEGATAQTSKISPQDSHRA
jgi:hypothetical protein